MVADLRLMTDPLPDLAVGDVLEVELGVSRRESYIFESSSPPLLLRMRLVSFLRKIASRTLRGISLSSLQRTLMLLVASFLVMFSCCREIVGNLCRMFLNTFSDSSLSSTYFNLVANPAWNAVKNSSLIFSFGSQGQSVSRNWATIRWGRRRVSLKYLVPKRECCWTVLNHFWCLLPTGIYIYIKHSFA